MFDFDAYNNKTHLIGRIATVVVLLMLLASPFVMGGVLGGHPEFAATVKGYLSVGIIWTVSSVAEFLIYTPMLGAGGTYLAFITGNLINMKIPCAFNARDMVGAKTGTPENEVVSTLAIATSSLVTILVLTLGVLLLVPLQPVLEAPALQPAFENVVPALFGALAFKYYRKHWGLSLAPVAVMSLLFTLAPRLLGSVSFMILPSGALSIGLALLFWKRSQLKKG